MAGLKITPTSAMRARDVSRPRAEQLAAAAEREDAVTRHGDRPANAAMPNAITRSAAPMKAPVPIKPPVPTAPVSSYSPTVTPAKAVAAAEPVEAVAGDEPTTARRRRRRGR